MFDPVTKYAHNVWEEEEGIHNNKSLPSGIFVFHIRIRHVVTWFNTTQEDAMTIINQVLSPLGIPSGAMPPMIRDVSSFARIVAAKCFEAGRS
ncbi:unnamed protein product [Ilex paraguariensis]|uniref:Uncharacterized protein n=1 Tax=Ilex paraguariensis TaxID=185542 RepID=A0ABC8SIM1_9AQUA